MTLSWLDQMWKTRRITPPSAKSMLSRHRSKKKLSTANKTFMKTRPFRNKPLKTETSQRSTWKGKSTTRKKKMMRFKPSQFPSRKLRKNLRRFSKRKPVLRTLQPVFPDKKMTMALQFTLVSWRGTVRSHSFLSFKLKTNSIKRCLKTRKKKLK